jgi:hypothetical protein
MRTKSVLFTIFLLAILLALPAPPAPIMRATARAQTDWGKMPLYFIANQGQMDARVAYYVQGSDKTLYFTPEGVTFALSDLAGSPQEGEGKSRWVAKLDFVQANPVRPTGRDQTGTTLSYFQGARDEWHTGLPTYAKIVYHDLWQDVDLVYDGTVNRLKYEFIIQPGADPAQIRLAYRGATLRVNEAEQLEVSTPAGGFQDDAPVAYQEVDGERVPVAVEYVLEDATTYGFHVGAYDPALPLVIDPAVLVYCGYIGGSSWDEVEGIAVDAAGNAYVVGDTNSPQATFPVTVGPDLTHNGGYDAFVAKVKADGTGLDYCGYIGGSSNDYGHYVALDLEGNAYIGGTAASTEATFPVMTGPDLTYNGGTYDAFVAKVKADGTGLVYNGYIGGTGWDEAWSIAVNSGNAYVVGETDSTEASLPVVTGPDLTSNGGDEVFVAKVKADGTGLDYCGYIGGTGDEYSYGIAVDSAGSAYIGGETYSSEASFPVTVGPDLTYGGNGDAFVAKVKTDGTGLDYCGYIGGSAADYGYRVALDTAGSAYVVGETNSTQASFPVIAGPDLTYNGGTYDAFVAKVKANGTGLDYCGYIGGSDWELAWAIAVDPAGNAYIAGTVDSTEATFPVALGPDLTHNGSDDVFVAKVVLTNFDVYLPLVLRDK